MASNFPSSLDTFTNPSSTDAMDSVSVPHATQHSDLNDAVEALQAKVGADSSAVTSSHDYKIADHASRLTTLEANESLVKVTSATFSGSSAVAFASGVFTTDYDNYRILFEFIPTATSALACQLNVSGSAQSSNSYFGSYWEIRTGALFGANPGTSHTIMHANASTPANNSLSIDIFKPATAAVRTGWHGTFYGSNSVGSFSAGITGAEYNLAEAHDGLTFTPSSGTITGKYTVYGYN